MILSLFAEIDAAMQAAQALMDAKIAQQSHDAVWIALATALPSTIAALAAFVQSLRNGSAAALAKTAAEAAAVKTEKVASDLKKNTELTEKARETAAIIQEQTNGMRERQDLLIKEMLKTVGEHGTAIKTIQQKLAFLPSSKDSSTEIPKPKEPPHPSSHA